MPHRLPSKANLLLRRLLGEYEQSKRYTEKNLIAASRVNVIEGVDYDKWNGGTYGHDLYLYVPMTALHGVKIDDQEDLEKNICSDLNKLTNGYENEYFRKIHIEPIDENDPECRDATPFSDRITIDPDSVTIWKSGHIRLFISHRDRCKAEANQLASELEDFGISSFVAHDTIEATVEWRSEIMRGLETMEVMLVFLTDDFDESVWSNQEVGFALGKGVPIISLKLEKKDPPGFISNAQALRGSLKTPIESAFKLQKLIYRQLGKSDRLNEGLISSFISSPSFHDTKVRFNRMSEAVDKLTQSNVDFIVSGFYKNDQLHNCVYITNQRLKRFLERHTEEEFVISGRRIVRSTVKSDATEENQFPF